tara:strand:+ start:643 stop:939 length:297 start_codon:yes stop_codon:yes gene_type:complete
MGSKTEEQLERSKKWVKSITPKGDVSWYIKWIASVFIIFGMMMTSLDVSFYPTNLYFHLIGVSGWFVVGFLWHDRSLIVVNGIAMTIFAMGILKTFIQ